jgi:hypothetical protein
MPTLESTAKTGTAGCRGLLAQIALIGVPALMIGEDPSAASRAAGDARSVRLAASRPGEEGRFASMRQAEWAGADRAGDEEAPRPP